VHSHILESSISGVDQVVLVHYTAHDKTKLHAIKHNTVPFQNHRFLKKTCHCQESCEGIKSSQDTCCINSQESETQSTNNHVDKTL
jgi:hypothetical protein